ncbi:MAG TPA: type 2 isopentenyl-diphosphate Delta-isomerase [Candidatus Dojkabacteria bacterium]|nr:type 2 isopentenyl-diphosphate Delta-isomerase [Candidatus Dojkabacteria bacterium]HRO65201.1 type 2 isopentenyl-diphosphate Delta-isomerase [Candidatus Dojkabacteria bacterium]HRP37655.1 type 2 isopentenyl-diphosphate Delta-isomerase [Candidatus Dojkabacteria bacterium]HRP50995.1 type 2 isopentenyl-diphosphate Delta-isomerase [Candidatus Dojkabacteria bacterium]
MSIKDRKLQHIKIVLEKDTQPYPSSFDKYILPHKSLPEIDLKEIDTTVKFFDKEISFPFMIASMTGGEEFGKTINTNLAIAAEKNRIPLALGSMRVILKKPESLDSFNVRHLCPSVPLFANMGLVQLNYGYGAKEINKLIDMIEADGIFLHINHLQEAIQPEGDTNFKGLIDKLAKILPKIKKPVLIKEVGNGIDKETAKRLSEIGIKWIDVSGGGGTSWPWVEGYRRDDDLGDIFKTESIPTDKCLIDCGEIEDLNLIACGGIRNGKHIALSVMLGADMASCAKPLLQPALVSPEACTKLIEKYKKEFQISMFTVGAKGVEELKEIQPKLNA